MKYCAVICELNPFHNGHEYIFRHARETSGCDRLIAVMSGGFVQRAIPAFLDVRSRAECALKFGADLVIELPVVYSCASGDVFARGAVDILNTIPEVTHLVMGAENADKRMYMRYAGLRASGDTRFSEALSRGLAAGLSYARALTFASGSLLGDEFAELLTRPNNILAAGYALALKASGSNIEFTPIARASDPSRYASATELRADGASVSEKYMPPAAREIWLKNRPDNIMLHYGALLLHAIREKSPEEIARTPDCAEGFENKIKTLARSACDFEEFMRKVPTSRFTRGRIMRICLHNLLGIEGRMQRSGYVSARLLGVREDAKDMLSCLPSNIIIGKRGEAAVPNAQRECFDAERRASDLWALLAGRPCDFYSRLLIV